MCCDRCREESRVLYMAKNVGASNVEIVGQPWYCKWCMDWTQQSIGKDSCRITKSGGKNDNTNRTK